MIPENAEEDLVAVSDVASVRAVSNAKVDATAAARESLVAFKFGGSSLLGADRMLHAAGLVRPVAPRMQLAANV